MTPWQGVRIYTVGHSTRSFDELVQLLEPFDVSVLVDIRTVPRSRRNPQFNVDALPERLDAQGVRYAHVPQLGGLRRARPDSTNAAWRNASFRGYADHMLTDEFEEGLEELRRVLKAGESGTARGALMCAEAVPWRCHRSLVADVLSARGALVEHIMAPGRAQKHRMTPFAKVSDPVGVRGARVTYPGEGDA